MASDLNISVSDGVAWHTMPVDDVFSRLDAVEGGLKSEEARRRFARDGRNELNEKSCGSPFLIFLAQFKSFVVVLLIVASDCWLVG